MLLTRPPHPLATLTDPVLAWGSPEGTGVIAGTMFLICVVILQLFYGRDSADKVSAGARSRIISPHPLSPTPRFRVLCWW